MNSKNQEQSWERQYPLNTFGYDTTTHKELVEFIKKLIQKAKEESKLDISLCPDCNCMTHKVCGKCSISKAKEDRDKEILEFVKDNPELNAGNRSLLFKLRQQITGFKKGNK